jgi:hypothetical protein
MTPFSAWRDGVARVNRAPMLLVGGWVMTIAISTPLMLVMRGMIAGHLGASLEADLAASGVNYSWMQEFEYQASGIGVTFRPTIIGFGAVLDNLSAFVDDVPAPLVVAGAASAYIALWLFVAGGILDRYARDRAIRAPGFFSASGVFFFRFLRLGIIQLAVYALLFRSIHPFLFGRIFPRLTHEMTVERTAFLVRVVLYALFLLLLGACSLVFDYAKVRAVVEDRRSMVGALAAAIRFVLRQPAAAALYLLNWAVFVLVLVVYAVVAPGAGAMMWVVFTVGQVYIAARLWVKLVFWASEIALFQSRLAHAGYVATTPPIWPESPAAEAIRL